MKVFAIGYLGLLFLDAVLSLADSTLVTNLHLSKWTTIILCLGSALVFIVAAIGALVSRFRPRWPLLLGSGAYSLYFGTILASALLGFQQERTAGEQHVWNLAVAGVQLSLAVVCLTAVARSRPGGPGARSMRSDRPAC